MTESYAVMRYDVNGYDADVNVNSKNPTTIVIIAKQSQFAPMIEIYLRGDRTFSHPDSDMQNRL